MIKRTKGRLLLTLLVITGLAGTVNDTSLTKQERKFAVTEFKDTKSDFLSSLKGLSEAQLNFKAGPERWSIKECAFHIALAEKGLLEALHASLKGPATPEKRSEVKMSDQDLIKGVGDRTHKMTAPEGFQPKNAPFKTLDEAVTAFKVARAESIKYTKTTTEDLRNHMFQLPFGWIDDYQLLLLIGAHSGRHTQQILEVKADPNFPKQ